MLDVEQRWELIDKIAKRTIKFGKYRHTLKDAVAEITVMAFGLSLLHLPDFLLMVF